MNRGIINQEMLTDSTIVFEMHSETCLL